MSQDPGIARATDADTSLVRPLWTSLPDVIGVVAGASLMVTLWSTWMARRTYPFDLEWMEGGMLAHAWRLQQGQPLYSEPSASWIPYIYPPGYPALVAALSGGAPLTPALGRSVSVASALVVVLALWAGGWRQLREPLLGLVAGMVFLSCYTASGGFYDLVRPDALGVALFALSALLSFERRWQAQVLGGLLLAVAFTVKHNLAIFGVPFALALWARDGWRPALRWGLASAGPALAFVGLMQLGSGGHFLTYLLGVAGAHPFKGDRAFPGALYEVFGNLGFLVGGGLLCAVLAGRAALPSTPPWVPASLVAVGGVIGWLLAGSLPMPDAVREIEPWLVTATWAMLGGLVGWLVALVVDAVRGRAVAWRAFAATAVLVVALVAAALMRGHHGGFINVYMPAHAVICGVFVIAATAARARVFAVAGRHGALAAVALAAVTVAAPAAHLRTIASDFRPARLIPTDGDIAAGERVVEALRACDGPIWAPGAAYLPVYAGQAPSMHLIALWDINHRRGPLRAGVDVVRDQVRDGYFACVLEQAPSVGNGVLQHYKVREHLRLPRGRLAPRTGWRSQPASIMVPKRGPYADKGE